MCIASNEAYSRMPANERVAPARKHGGGFTLIELLVVMAIISMLAALLLAGMSSVKGTGMRTVCLNNLRQINAGVRMYSDDANDKSPNPEKRPHHPYDAYKELMKSYVGLKGASSAQDRVFAPNPRLILGIWKNTE
jgi:prepilin-type N-terminal cleavage/methylation domain-containing protein